MFDIGFWELAVIAVVALLVVGPEEFPALVRTGSGWLRKIRAFIQDARSELEQEVNKAEELKRLVEKETEIARLHEIIDEANSSIAVNHAPDKDGRSAPAGAEHRIAPPDSSVASQASDSEQALDDASKKISS